MDGSAYAVAARIGRVKPRVAGHATARDSGDPLAFRVVTESTWVGNATEATAFDAPALDEILGEHWSAFRERWSQLTFYLFDADGWR